MPGNLKWFLTPNLSRKRVKSQKKDLQPCFARWKAHGGSRNQSAFRGNLDAHPWKFIEIKWFSMNGRLSSRRRRIDSGCLHGFSPIKTRLEIFFYFDLFSCSNKGFQKSKRYLAQKRAKLALPERHFWAPYTPPSCPNNHLKTHTN